MLRINYIEKIGYFLDKLNGNNKILDKIQKKAVIILQPQTVDKVDEKTQLHLLFLCNKCLNQAIYGYKYTKDGGSYAIQK